MNAIQQPRLDTPLSVIVSDLIAPVVAPADLQRTEDNLVGSINIQYDIGIALQGRYNF